ncbi:MAG: CPBP family intramembrane metalloprotease [Holophagales bacterium]|nr:CPBP family intramembrane metalloprotease [Holophagales bacterium]
MPLRTSILFFGGFGGLALFLLTLAAPMVSDAFGLAEVAGLAAMGVALHLSMIAASAVLHAREGRPFVWSAIKERARFTRLTRREWLLVLLGVLLVDASFIALQLTAEPIASLFPQWLTAHSEVDFGLEQGDFVGLALFAGLVVLNVVSEEVLWRGYLLPRQELQHGRHAWWIHGLLWTGFHWFKPWELIALLPGAFVYGWLCTRTKSIVPGLVLHFGLNGLAILMVALRVLG